MASSGVKTIEGKKKTLKLGKVELLKQISQIIRRKKKGFDHLSLEFMKYSKAKINDSLRLMARSEKKSVQNRNKVYLEHFRTARS